MKKKDVAGMDLELKAFINFTVDDNEDKKAVPDSPADPVGDFLYREQWGIDRPGGAKSAVQNKPLSPEQVAKALTQLQKHLGTPGFGSTTELVQKLAEAAREYLPEGNFTREWFEAYAVGDTGGMRGAVKKLVAASKAEILAHVAKGGSWLDLLIGNEKELPN